MEKFGSGINIPDPQHCLRYWVGAIKRKVLFNLLRGRFESLEDIELRDRREKTEQREKDKKEKLRAERLKRMQAFQVQLIDVEDQKIFCFMSGEKYRNLCGAVFVDPSQSANTRTVNSMEQRTRVFCQTDFQGFCIGFVFFV
jgi:hypothetical protein